MAAVGAHAGVRRPAHPRPRLGQPSVAGPRRPQDRVPLTMLRENFHSNYPEGLECWRARRSIRPEGGTVEDRPPRRSRRATRRRSRRRRRRRTSRRPPRSRRAPRHATAPTHRRFAFVARRRRSGRVRGDRRHRRAPTPRTRRSWSAPGSRRNAVARGLRVSPTVKTSLAPGSKAVTGYLEHAGLMAPLEQLGFALAGYGCTTCIGNSGRWTRRSPRRSRSTSWSRGRPFGQPQLRGPDPSPRARELPRVAAAGRGLRARRPHRRRPDDGAARHRRRRAPRLPRRHLALAGRDPRRHPRFDRPELFRRTYASVFDGDVEGPADPGRRSLRLGPASTYMARPPFFEGLAMTPEPPTDIVGARVLAGPGRSP